MILLTKSQFLASLDCSQRAWLKAHRRDLAAKIEGRRALVGQEVGRLAHGLFPGGVLAWGEGDTTEQALERTRALVNDPSVSVIYEAAFEAGPLFARADILVRTGQSWKVVEVKSSGSIKPQHSSDIGYQVLVLERAGLTLSSACLALINKEYVWEGGAINPQEFFALHERLDDARKRSNKLLESIQRGLAALALDEAPGARRKSACRECEYQAHCYGAELPGTDLVYMPYAKEDWVAGLEAMGISDIRQVPASYKLNDTQRDFIDRISVDELTCSPALEKRLAAIAFPALYLDFEVDGPALPWVTGMRPFQAVPFQFQGEWETAPGVRGGSATYLWPTHAPEGDDPRITFVAALLPPMREAKTVVVYSDYEGKIINGLRQAGVPGADELDDLFRVKVVDLLKIVADCVRHPGFEGKHSVKKVLPALCPEFSESYSSLNVKNGDEAVDAFLRLRSPAVVEAERQAIADSLIEYCTLDVVAMIEIVRALRAACGG